MVQSVLSAAAINLKSLSTDTTSVLIVSASRTATAARRKGPAEISSRLFVVIPCDPSPRGYPPASRQWPPGSKSLWCDTSRTGLSHGVLGESVGG